MTIATIIKQRPLFYDHGHYHRTSATQDDIDIQYIIYNVIIHSQSKVLNLASCSEHFISIKHRILATFDINKKNQSERLYAFK